jgi:uracil-DNA glycosylase
MINQLEVSWRNILSREFEKPYFKSLQKFLADEYKTNTIFPAKEDLFSAFNYTPFNDVKVVIIGQDPYHGVNQAHGLCFSVNENVAIPPSLVNIFKEIHADLGLPLPNSGNLSHWAKQGVLLLNATLTVREHEAGSHQGKGWETFTDEVIQSISKEKENVVFLLWGGFAKKKAKLIDQEKHRILMSGHPSPLSANRGYWFGNKNFSQTNETLRELGETPIIW